MNVEDPENRDPADVNNEETCFLAKINRISTCKGEPEDRLENHDTSRITD